MLRSMRLLSLLLALSVSLAGFVRARCPVGDLSGDCQVDSRDLQILAQYWLVSPESSPQGVPTTADLNGDKRVNMVDLARLADKWRTEGTALVISEFLASNNATLLDEDGDSSDWIEIHNPAPAAVNLDGWYITDDAGNLKKWEFPAIELAPGGFCLIFASGKNRRDPDSELHTNFLLQAAGEFLALVESNGKTIAYAYDKYPPQSVDISYGLSADSASSRTDTILVPEFTEAKALIPTDGSLGLNWTEVAFDDSEWDSGTTGVGYDYGALIGLDVSAMRNRNQTAYVRIPFMLDSPARGGQASPAQMLLCEVARYAARELILRIKYEDGFVAYLNSFEVARANAPDPSELSWNSGATANRPDSDAVGFQDFDITVYKDFLIAGSNMLAIQVLNATLDSSDLLALPQLIAVEVETVRVPSTTQGYFLDPTPGTSNEGALAKIGPAIRNVTEAPPPPTADEDLIITAEVAETFAPVTDVRLVCRVNFEQDSRWLPSNGLTMADNGTGVDAVANDGTYTAAIPSRVYDAGDMVRWCVTAEDANHNFSRNPPFPYSDNSPEYFGTVVVDPSINTQLPVIQWFVQNVAASETDTGTRGSVYYLGQFYDNVAIHRRGGSTAGVPKTHFKFRFNRGYKFEFDPSLPRMNEFNLNSPFSDKAYLRQNLAFEAYDWCGCPGSISFPVRAQRNGQFHGVYVFIEEPEEELLQREGLDPDGALYKMYNTFNAGSSAEKKTRRWEGRSDLDNFCRSINNSWGTARHNNIFDQVNLPLTLNYLAATIITHQNDHPHKNHYLYRDSEGSGEWCFLPWDHDLTWGSNWTGSSYHDYIYADDDQVPGKPTDVKPSHPFVGKQDCKEWNFHWNRLIDALLNDATVRQMYLRRLRTVMDELLKPPGTPYSQFVIEKRIDELVALMAQDVARDYAKWANPWPWGGQGGYPKDQSFQYAIDVIKNDYLAVRRNHLFVTHNVGNLGSYNIPGSYSAAMPNAQPANAPINFGSYDYNPTSSNQDEEYIELVNLNNYAVDISGWKLTGGVEHTFLPGTVIAVGSSLYVSPNVRAFRSRADSPTGGEGRFAQGNYRGHLSSWGETITLLNKQGAMVNTMSYPGNPSDQQRFLRVTEIMYNPPEGGTYDNQEYEYIELKNIGSDPLVIDSVKFTNGIYYTFAAASNLILATDDHIVIVKNRAAFASWSDTSGVKIAPGVYTGSLSNTGEKIKLEDRTNSTILDFDYNDGWYDITDGIGFSLTIKDPYNTEPNDWSEKYAWRPSSSIGGSPGWDDKDEVPELGSIKINELLAHSHAGEPDWIELHNTTNEAINIGGWFLSDDQDNLTKYEIAEGTIIDPCGYHVFYQDLHFGNINDPGCHEVFALSENGETLYLHSGRDGTLTGYSEEEKFGPSETDVAFGRYKKSTGTFNFVAMSENTPGSANAYPKVGPVVINEIMYHPQNNGDAEYVELLNITGDEIVLQGWDNEQARYVGWRFSDEGGISFDFPLGTTLAAGEHILLVRNLAAFTSEFGSVPAGAQVFEWALGKLDNGGEKIELSKPGDEVEGERYYIRVDRVNYSDGSHPVDEDPWPQQADGQGKSLSRIDAELYGNDVVNWQASTPSPGN